MAGQTWPPRRGSGSEMSNKKNSIANCFKSFNHHYNKKKKNTNSSIMTINIMIIIILNGYDNTNRSDADASVEVGGVSRC